MKYKLSRYNITFKLGRNFYIFNTYKLGIAKVDRRIYELVSTGKNMAGNALAGFLNKQGEMDSLAEGGYIVEKNLDEAARVWIHYNVNRFSSDFLSLTIIPTDRCNLSCVYCYQERGHVTMDEKIRCQLVEFVKENIKNRKGLAVTWYGGEPLLALPVVKSLSSEFIRYCMKHKKQYRARMVTNGTLINRETVSQLSKCRIERVQVTLDGPQEIHDKRRPFSGNVKNSSFERIIEGLKYLKGKIPVVVRVNIDRSNKGVYMKLVKLLERQNILDGNENCTIGLGYVRPWTDNISHIEESCVNMDEFSRLQVDIMKRRLKKNISEETFPRQGALCGSVSRHSYVITPDGSLVKCWINVNHKNLKAMAVGDIFRGLDYEKPAAVKWLSYDPYNHSKKCRKCVYFPLCLGGCPFIRLYRSREADQICGYWEREVTQMVKLYIKEH